MIFSRANFAQPSEITYGKIIPPKSDRLYVCVIIESGGCYWQEVQNWRLKKSKRSSKKQKSSRKISTSASLTMPKPLTVWITTNWGKFLKRWEYQITWPASWEICMQVRKQVRTGHGTTDWFQIRTGVHQGCILSPCLFNLDEEYIMRNAGLEETQAGIKIAGRNINHLRYAMTPPLWQKVKRN